VSPAPKAYKHCHAGRPYPNVPRTVQAGGTTEGDTDCRPGWSRGAAVGARLQPALNKEAARTRRFAPPPHERRRGASQ